MSEWDEGYRKALEDVYDSLKSQHLEGAWWHIMPEIPHKSANGVADEEKPDWVTW